MRRRLGLWRLLLLPLMVAATAAAAAQGEEEGEGDEGQPLLTTCPCDVSAAAAALNCSSRDLDALALAFALCGGGGVVLAVDASHNRLASLKDLAAWSGGGGGRSLNVSHNALTDAAWDAGAEAAWKDAVEELDASWNEIETFHAERMRNLRTLRVSGNRLQTLLLPDAADGCKLESVDVAANRLTRLPEGLWTACPSLSHVDASRNVIKDLPVDIVLILDSDRMSGNVSVDLRGNPLAEADVTAAVRTATETLGCLRVTPDVDDCACAFFEREDKGFKGLRLCVSSMCERWSAHCRPPTASQPETSTLHPERSSGVEPLVTSPPPPPRVDRRGRRLALALVLTAVALVLGAGLVAALVALYRRRRREVRLEAARLALKPLVSDTTPRFMRATEDDFRS